MCVWIMSCNDELKQKLQKIVNDFAQKNQKFFHQ